MQNFTYHNPTKIVFGKGSIAELAVLLPSDAVVLLTYGGGSIKKNGVYDQVMAALQGRKILEFSGIEPNPRYETCMQAVEICRREAVTFLLAVGGGSVLDGTKFIAAAAHFTGGDPWDILAKQAPFTEALPIGCVMTLPATGSESNGFSVVSRQESEEKLAFFSPLIYPKFAVLDPETTYTLPERQTANGVVDAIAHVLEQYLTYDVNAPLQDRQAEGIIQTLVAEGPKLLTNPGDYDARANVMWAATQALNGLIACGVPQDWTTHMIGHELTALYGLDHAQTLAVVFPAVMRYKQAQKSAKLLQFGERVWGVTSGSESERIATTIEKTEQFFRSMGAKTRLAEYGVTEGVDRIAQRFTERGVVLGEQGDIHPADVDAILALCAR